MVASGTSLYIVGGIELANSLAVASLYQYDTILQQYMRLADMPQPNCRGGAAVLGGKIYVVAGFASADESGTGLGQQEPCVHAACSHCTAAEEHAVCVRPHVSVRVAFQQVRRVRARRGVGRSCSCMLWPQRTGWGAAGRQGLVS